jgi:hypothetical protein
MYFSSINIDAAWPAQLVFLATLMAPEYFVPVT